MNNNNDSFNNVKKELFDNMHDVLNMKTQVWGPPAWFFLHSMAMAYPKKINPNNPEHIRIKNAMFTFLSNLGTVLPCTICGISYSNYIKDSNLSVEKYLNSRADLSYYIWLIHEKVNTKLGVPQCDRTNFRETIEFYYKFRAQGKVPCSATTEQERINSLLTGCDDKDIKKKHFKDYKCYIKIVDKNDTNQKNVKEYFGEPSNNNSINITLLILCLCFFILTIILIIFILKNKKKIFS
tara:strand:+ start:1766 stop:2479 length:714 start_codon:yes stop_codon:yes gene_type:complete